MRVDASELKSSATASCSRPVRARRSLADEYTGTNRKPFSRACSVRFNHVDLEAAAALDIAIGRVPESTLANVSAFEDTGAPLHAVSVERIAM
jgi:hypothetical protein